MSRMSWKNPPACIVLGGDEDLLRGRELHKATLVTQQSGRPVIWAASDSEVVDTLTSASTFGESCLIICALDKISLETVQEVKKNPPPLTCLLVLHEGELDEKKFPALAEVHGGFRISHMRPTSKKGLKSLAVRFARKEAEDLLGGNKEALDEKLAEALVDAVGSELGVVAFEISKATAMVRFEGGTKISSDHLKKLLRASSEIDLAPMREALRNRDGKKLAVSLDRIQRVTTQDPVMLLLRGKGGPADLAVTWLRVALFLKKGGTQTDVSQRLGIPDWSVPDVMLALKNWDVSTLRRLVRELAAVDLSVLRGAPNPWYALQSQLLLFCSKSS